eukprot:scaffold2141_cov44-Attheya_sp.AAC.3
MQDETSRAGFLEDRKEDLVVEIELDWVGLFGAAMTTSGPFPDNAASTCKAVGTSQLSNSTQSTIVCPAASGITTTVGNWSPMNSPRKPIVRPWRAVAPPCPHYIGSAPKQ